MVFGVSTVFLTYRHTNSKHPKHHVQVKELGRRLRSEGLGVILDQFAQEEEFNQGGPSVAGGWARWSFAQVEKADKVLIIGSAEYYRVYEGNEREGVGLGAAIEANRIFTQLYQQGGRNERFRVVILGDGDDEKIPEDLSGFHRFFPYRNEEEFRNLVCWLKGSTQVAAESISVASHVITWPQIDRGFQPDFADRSDEFSFVVSMLSGQTKERILLLEGESSHGKTTFLSECMKYFRRIMPEGTFTVVDFKGNPTREGALDTIRLELSPILPSFRKPQGTPYELRSDLRSLAKPAVIVFDSYEKASSEARQLVEGLLLGDLESLPAVNVVIAGQYVPDHQRALWAPVVRHFRLGPITEPKDWERFAARHFGVLTAPEIATLTSATAGNPGVLRQMLGTLAAAANRR
jgi:hypothetical protein